MLGVIPVSNEIKTPAIEPIQEHMQIVYKIIILELIPWILDSSSLAETPRIIKPIVLNSRNIKMVIINITHMANVNIWIFVT